MNKHLEPMSQALRQMIDLAKQVMNLDEQERAQITAAELVFLAYVDDKCPVGAQPSRAADAFVSVAMSGSNQSLHEAWKAGFDAGVDWKERVISFWDNHDYGDSPLAPANPYSADQVTTPSNKAPAPDQIPEEIWAAISKAGARIEQGSDGAKELCLALDRLTAAVLGESAPEPGTLNTPEGGEHF